MKLRVLLLNHNVARSGGTFFRAFFLARELARLGYDVTLLAISPNKRAGTVTTQSEGVRLVETPDVFWGIGRTGWDPWDTLNRVGFALSERFDLVHAFDCRPAVILPSLVATVRWRCPLIIDWADWWGRGGTIEERPYRAIRSLFGAIETWFEESFRARASANTVISRALGLRAQALGVPPERIHRIPQGCDGEGIVPVSRLAARHVLGFPADWQMVGHLGVLLSSDAALLFESVEHLFDQLPRAHLILIGTHKAVIPDVLRATGRVIEAGFVPEADLATWLGACDALVLSLADSVASRGRWPSKGNAYLAAGRPVVATGVSDFAEYLSSWNAGLVTRPEARSLGHGLLEALSAQGRQTLWGQNARALAEGPLAWPRLAGDLNRVYESVLEQQ